MFQFIKMNQGPTVGKDFFGSMENGMGRDERDDQKRMHGSNQNLNQGRKSALVRPFQSQGEVLQKYDEPPTPKNSQKNILHSEPSYLKQQNNLQGSPLLKQDPQMTQNRNPVNNNPAKSPLGISNTRLGHVRYNFEAQTEIELDLRAGDIVNIRKQVDENWFDGYIGNRRGIFPIDYVEILSNGRQNGVTKSKLELFDNLKIKYQNFGKLHFSHGFEHHFSGNRKRKRDLLFRQLLPFHEISSRHFQYFTPVEFAF